ncbi:MAG: GatB/YqeY domain-containing protein [Phototrophicaceae bacterium]
MAEYKDKLMAAVKDAMRNKDNERRDSIRQLQAAIKQVEVDEQKELSTEEEMDILIKEAKKLRESIAELNAVDRPSDDEERELAIIESFLPEQMSEEEIRKLAQQAIDETGASEMRDMGKVMGKLSAQTKGKADGKLVSTIVRELLNA